METEDLTVAEAARRLGLSRRRVSDLIQAGRLPAHRAPQGPGPNHPWRIWPADLAAVATRRPGWPGQQQHRHKGDPR